MAEYVIKSKVEIKITDEDIDDIMCAALEGGVNYWCYRVDVVGGNYLGEWAHEQISRGGRLRFFDSESDDTWILTKNKFLKGIKLWVENGYAKEAMYDGGLDTGMIDAIGADLIVQFALFGEVIFG